MNAPLSAIRERQIRDLPASIRRHAWTAAEDAADAIRELAEELDRLRAHKCGSDAACDEADLGEQMRQRNLGAYRLFWKSGGSSVAVVGQLYNGSRWYACANWTTGSVDSAAGLIGTEWSRVDRVEEIPTGGDE